MAPQKSLFHPSNLRQDMVGPPRPNPQAHKSHLQLMQERAFDSLANDRMAMVNQAFNARIYNQAFQEKLSK